jgi:hypothetical protein
LGDYWSIFPLYYRFHPPVSIQREREEECKRDSINLLEIRFYWLEKKPRGTVPATYTNGGFEESLWWAATICISPSHSSLTFLLLTVFTSGAERQPETTKGKLLTFVGILACCILGMIFCFCFLFRKTILGHNYVTVFCCLFSILFCFIINKCIRVFDTTQTLNSFTCAFLDGISNKVVACWSPAVSGGNTWQSAT